MNVRKRIMSAAATMAVVAFGFAGAASALTATCSGSPSAANISWTASASGGINPVAFLWGNGSTSSTQVIAGAPGLYSMTLQATDASSTIATTTCAATIAQPVPMMPTITSFTAAPAAITTGGNSVLSWVATASSTSINNGVGVVSGTSVTVSPIATTVYTLTAVSPGGTTTAQTTVTVNAIPATTTPGLSSQIALLLQQIAALKAQIVQLLLQQQGGSVGGGSTGTSTPATCFSFNRDLRRGHDGDDVRQLQLMLASDPSIMASGSVTGFFGPKTEEALKKLQKKMGLSSSGFFGPLSRKYFKEQCVDTDHDGVLNLTDTDDDNDGIIDTSDPHPLISESKFSTSTKNRSDDSNKGKGNHDD